MSSEEVFANVLLMILCYVYILFIIFVSSNMDKLLHVSQKASHKFLHAMMGNLPYSIFEREKRAFRSCLLLHDRCYPFDSSLFMAKI